MSTKKREINKKLGQLEIAIDAVATYCRKQSTSVTEFHRLGCPIDRTSEAGENLAKILITFGSSTVAAAIEILIGYEHEFGPVTQFAAFTAKIVGKGNRFELKVTTDSQEEIDNDLDTFIRNLLTVAGVQNV